MASLAHFDLLLGDALEQLMDASAEIRELEGIEKKAFLMKIGRVVSELWNIREQVYKIRPELTRDFVLEHKQDRTRFEMLNQVYQEGSKLEKSGDFTTAENMYQKLRRLSRSGYFLLLAEAGLYRISLKKSQET